MPRRKSRAKTGRRVCLARIHPATGCISSNRWNVGDIVRFNSPMRRNLIPSKGDQHGEIIATGLFSVTVRFFAFPDEPLFLAPNEIRRATGTRTRKEKQKQQQQYVQQHKPKKHSTDWIRKD